MNEMLTRIRRSFLHKPLPLAAEAERQRDHRQGLGFDPGLKVVIGACTDWLCAAQDHSASADGGVARDYSLIKGWATSYPETTGYIIPTMIELANRFDRIEIADRGVGLGEPDADAADFLLHLKDGVGLFGLDRRGL